MSSVTNIILTAPSGADDPASQERAVNEWLRGDGHPPLLAVDDLWRGHKGVEARIWIGAFNHLDLYGFLARVRGAFADDLDDVRVFAKEDDFFAFDEKLHACAKCGARGAMNYGLRPASRDDDLRLLCGYCDPERRAAIDA